MQITSLQCKLQVCNANYKFAMQITSLQCKLQVYNANYKFTMQITNLQVYTDFIESYLAATWRATCPSLSGSGPTA
jgi:hypothetical protein